MERVVVMGSYLVVLGLAQLCGVASVEAVA